MIHLCLIVDITSPEARFLRERARNSNYLSPHYTFMDNFNLAETLQQKYSACTFQEIIWAFLESLKIQEYVRINIIYLYSFIQMILVCCLSLAIFH